MFDGRIGLDGSGGGFGTIPSIGGPFNRFDEGGASQGVIAFGIGMIYDPPVAVHIVDQCAVSFRPPVVMGTIGMHYRIIGRIFHGPVTLFERAATAMWLVAGPAVPPCAEVR